MPGPLDKPGQSILQQLLQNFGNPSATLNVGGTRQQLEEGVPTFDQSQQQAAAQASQQPQQTQQPTVQQPDPSQGQQGGGGFMQKLLQVLMNPAVQRTAGLGVSALKSPADLRGFQRQEQLNINNANTRLNQEFARNRDTRADAQLAETQRRTDIQQPFYFVLRVMPCLFFLAVLVLAAGCRFVSESRQAARQP